MDGAGELVTGARGDQVFLSEISYEPNAGPTREDAGAEELAAEGPDDGGQHEVVNPDSQAEYDYHPLASRFPLIEGTEFQDLVADVRANGLFEEIVLHEGKVLDGRNRYRACIEAGVEPRFLQFDASWGDPWAFVLSRNAHRRHLTPEQRRQVVLGAVAAGETHAETAKRAGTTCLIPRSVGITSQSSVLAVRRADGRDLASSSELARGHGVQPGPRQRRRNRAPPPDRHGRVRVEVGGEAVRVTPSELRRMAHQPS